MSDLKLCVGLYFAAGSFIHSIYTFNRALVSSISTGNIILFSESIISNILAYYVSYRIVARQQC
ncbi:uncharacterized protein F4812DRAFT_435816 [Daldinia caldariorum]|uniref:uncharacterized protein n=1 Tax=Daldinia caldariorum TaxID=326644 RepID=UPI002007FEB9|nr:uncharacterized protein F4812DRAFT_435816 [Daldinia caldariorum]KAI1466071.1 hypothetical protein F4812DRAFT_435816 [Daldinia caldariorum]